MEEEGARYAVDRYQHDGKYDSSPATAGNRTEREGTDQISHAEEIPRDRSAPRVGLSRIPPIGDQRCENPGQQVADARGNRKERRQLALEVADQEHAADDSDCLYADQPMLRYSGDD